MTRRAPFGYDKRMRSTLLLCLFLAACGSSSSTEGSSASSTTSSSSSTSGGVAGGCAAHADCAACLGEGCNWTGGRCESACLMDTYCYGPGNSAAPTCPAPGTEPSATEGE
ncbi:MAG: hypothetical protein K1X94_10515 [Sandaracinaceae bacterium]|nr:hypothetical protein [Sandaracinaceae bacterium]